MGFAIELRSQEWERRKFTSELIYESDNANYAAEIICGCISEPYDANVYKPFSVMHMESIVAKLKEELAKTTPPISKGEADEYKELLNAIEDFKKKHQEDWGGMEFLYIYGY